MIQVYDPTLINFIRVPRDSVSVEEQRERGKATRECAAMPLISSFFGAQDHYITIEKYTHMWFLFFSLEHLNRAGPAQDFLWIFQTSAQ